MNPLRQAFNWTGTHAYTIALAISMFALGMSIATLVLR